MVSTPPQRTREIRHDIDGLRALAVLIVVFYHIGLSDFGGGFIGVDVFFVISGYLIIPTVRSQMMSGNFSLPSFMLRRLRRLVPALLPVLVFSSVIALLFSSDKAFADYANSAVSASAFLSNYVFFDQSGYFGRGSDTILLLHSWSLGVEFQFYLILALLALLVRSRLVLVLVVLSIASFALAETLVRSGSAYAFFAISPRFWELAAGGLLGMLHIARPSVQRIGWVCGLRGSALSLLRQFCTAQP